MQALLGLVSLFGLSASYAAVILTRINDVMTPLKDLGLKGFDFSPDGTDSLLASDNVVRCNARVPLSKTPEVDGLVFGEASAIASKNSLVYMLEEMSVVNTSLSPDYTFSQECRGAGVSVSNFGPARVETDVPIHAIDQALWILIEHCVKKHNMTGSLSSRNGIQVDITEWASEERCGSRYSLRAGSEKSQKKDLPAAVVVGFLGLLLLL